LRSTHQRQQPIDRHAGENRHGGDYHDELEQREAAGVAQRAGHGQPNPPAPAAISHSGRNTPSASTVTMAPTATIKSGSMAALKFSRS
jgi:hypothetical protein